MNPIHIIGMGMGMKDLTPEHHRYIDQANVLVGGQRHLDQFPDFHGTTRAIRGPLPRLMDEMAELAPTHRIVVLASGDPLFHGIGSTLLSYFSRDQLVFHPNINTVAAAFSAIKEPWQDARLVDLHKGTEPEGGFQALSSWHKFICLTGPETGPDYIAGKLLEHQLTQFTCWTLEALGHPTRERIQRFSHPSQLVDEKFRHPNAMVLIGEPRDIVPHGTHLGMADHRFSHPNGLITKSEVRAVTLAKLRLDSGVHTIWDIGAGSGSVSIEMALVCPQAHIHAVEKNPDRGSHITTNKERFHCGNLTWVQGDALEQMTALPAPDRIFIGGGGGDLPKIINHCCGRLNPGGQLVINTVVLQNMQAAQEALQANGFEIETTLLQISRSHPIPGGDRMVPLNPVWIISALRKDH
ncbi:MAG: precorrin-6y C5,15-methyltransferase (decarboxylating) subunit CbiE [Desulfobacterales bacterium]|nr:precorrin-6y C5,15-methyltransferase (decarboxylating) subunit CbiE [Desulfobacterales bacterium]